MQIISAFDGDGRRKDKMITWKFYRFKADAEKCYHEISSIGETATPQDIVRYAKDNKDSELHKCFTWDDTEAAEKWRVHEARQIVTNLVIVNEAKDEEEPTAIRLIQRTSSDGYAPISYFKRNEEEYDILLKRAKSELISFKNRYSQIAELEEVIELIDKIL